MPYIEQFNDKKKKKLWSVKTEKLHTEIKVRICSTTLGQKSFSIPVASADAPAPKA
jgi:hypothetical protein